MSSTTAKLRFLSRLSRSGCLAVGLRRCVASGCRPPRFVASYATSSSTPTPTPASPSPLSSLDSDSDSPYVYQGPLTTTFRRLKLFSLTSLSLSVGLSPFIFIIDSSLPWSARGVLALTALSTGSLSTGLVGWVAKPYVTELHFQEESGEKKGSRVLEMTTYSLTLQKRITRVYDTTFLADTRRPFAKYELAGTVDLPSSSSPFSATATPGLEETVAETLDANRRVLGRWIVRWDLSGSGDSKVVGVCRATGHVVRHFQVHEELLETPIR